MIDHAAAHERLADLALEPGALERAVDGATADEALAEHVATCERCQADVAGWRVVHRTLDRALRSTDPTTQVDLAPIIPSRVLRERVLARARDEARVPSDGRRPRAAVAAGRGWFGDWTIRWPRVPSVFVGLAAALVVAVGGTFVLAGPATNLLRTVDEARSLSGAVAAVDRILANPTHETDTLKSSGGQTAGTIAWSDHDLVVLTSALTEPAAGQTYKCWLSNGNRETAIGRMEFAGGTAYWVGSLDEWASISLSPGSRFIVSLEPANAAPGATRTGSVVLEANL